MNKLEIKDIVITNRGKQMIPIQVKPPNGDFFYEEHQIRLNPGKSITLPKHFLNWAQIENCQARGNLSIIESK
jgi:D-lyxose ketol-isomerase